MAEQLIQTMVINDWLDLPFDVEVVCSKREDLELAKREFRERFGRDCMVGFKLRKQWLMVVDPDVRLEQEKV